MKELMIGFLALTSVSAFSQSPDTLIELVDGGKISLISRTGETVNVSCKAATVTKKECVCVDGGFSIDLTLKQDSTKHVITRFSFNASEPHYSDSGKGQALSKCERKIIEYPQCF